MVVVTADRDRLRTSAQRFAAELADAGGDVVLIRHRGALHGFLNEPGDADAERTLRRFASELYQLEEHFMTRPLLPRRLPLGRGQAGHQVEGDNVTSDTWFAEHVSPTDLHASRPARWSTTGNRWREDLDLAPAMGLTACRFSVEWARVEPAEGQFSTPRRSTTTRRSSTAAWRAAWRRW